MKANKIIISLFTIFTIMLFSLTTTVNAFATTWTRETSGADYYMQTVIDLDANVSQVTLHLANMGYNAYEGPNTGNRSEIHIKYVVGESETTDVYDWEYFFNREDFGDVPPNDNPYVIDFGLRESDFFGYFGLATEITFIVYQDYGVESPPVLATTTTYFQTYSDVLFSYGLPYEDKMIFDTWEENDANYIITESEYLQEGVMFLNLYIPESPYHTDDGYIPMDGYSWQNGRAQIWFYHEAEPVFIIYIKDYLKDINVLNRIDGYISIDLAKVHADNDIDYSTLDFGDGDQYWWHLVIPQTWETVPDGYIEYLNNENFYTRNTEMRYAIYKANNNVYHTSVFQINPTPPSTDPTKTGYTFSGWYLSDGSRYSGGEVTDDMLFNNTLYLYAVFKIDDTVSYAVDDPTPDGYMGAVLDIVNANNTVGRLIVYLVIIGLMLWASNKFNLPAIMQVIAIALVTGFFMFLGFITILVSIIIFIVLTLVLLSIIKGGGV